MSPTRPSGPDSPPSDDPGGEAVGSANSGGMLLRLVGSGGAFAHEATARRAMNAREEEPVRRSRMEPRIGGIGGGPPRVWPKRRGLGVVLDDEALLHGNRERDLLAIGLARERSLNLV